VLNYAYSYFTVIILFLTIPIKTYSQTIVLDTITAEEKLSPEVKKIVLNQQNSMLDDLKRLPNTNVIGELSGHPFELVINGISGFRHNYSIWGIPINFESTSSNDLSLLGSGRYKSVNINYDNKFLANPIGSNVNFIPKINGKSTIFLKGESNLNFSFLESYIFPKVKKDFDLRATLDINRYKNRYDFFDNNGTLYNTEDDKITTYDNGWSNNFHLTLTENIKTLSDLKIIQDINIIERSVPMQKPQTNDPIEKIFSILFLGKFDKIFSDNLFYTQKFCIFNNTNEVIDTNLAVVYNMGYTSHTLNKKTKISMPFTFENFFANSEISLNILPSYDVGEAQELFTKKIVNNSSRFRLNENLTYNYHLTNHYFKNIDISGNIINSNRYDNSFGVYRIYNDTIKNYSNKENILNYSIKSKFLFGINKVSLHASSATRFPSLFELYGNNLFVVANPTLKRENSIIKYDIEYGFSLGNFILKGEYQYNLIDNMITSNMYNNRTIKFYNTNKAEINTISLFTTYYYKNQISLNFNISHNHAVNLSKGSLYGYTIPNIHPLTAKLLTNYHYKNFELTANGFYYSMVYTNRDNRVYIKPEGDYLSNNGSYGYIPEHIKIDIGLSHVNNYFKAGFDIKNILGNRVSMSPGYINQGRVFSLTLMKNI